MIVLNFITKGTIVGEDPRAGRLVLGDRHLAEEDLDRAVRIFGIGSPATAKAVACADAVHGLIFVGPVGREVQQIPR